MNSLVKEAKIRADVKQQSKFLNTVIGILGFTVGLTCFGFEDPQKPALLSLGIFIPLLVQAGNYYPSELKALKELISENPEHGYLKS